MAFERTGGPTSTTFCNQNDGKYSVTHWERIDLGLPTSYSPAPYAHQTSLLVKLLPKADVYVIERQYHRLGGFNVLETAFLGSIVEAQIHA